MNTGADLAILIPLWKRTAHIERVYASARAATPDARIQFIVSDLDVPTGLWARGVIDRATLTGDWRGGIVLVGGAGGEQGDYAKKINAGYRATDEPFIFTGADDLHFHPGWYDACRELIDGSNEAITVLQSGILTGPFPIPQIGVVGTNDLCNGRTIEGRHSTHSLVARWYADQGGSVDRDHMIYHEGYWHEYCSPPEATVWMADGTFRAIGEVVRGDEVMGWERTPAGRFTLRRLRPSRVLGVRGRTAPLVHVETESGRSVRCTPDHRWLNAAWSPASSHAAEYVMPRVGRTLLHVIDEARAVPAKLERHAGYLAGIYDGEGSGIQIAQDGEHNPIVRAAIRDALDALGVPYTETDAVWGFTITGGRQGWSDFLNRVQPTRREGFQQRLYGARFGHRDCIVSVEPLSSATDVVSMTTETGNYVAQGFASRNCDDEMVQTAMARRAYAHAHNAIVEHLHPNVGKSDDDPTYQHGRARTRLSRREFMHRRWLWTERAGRGELRRLER